MTFSFKVFITRLEHWFHLCEDLMIIDLDLCCLICSMTVTQKHGALMLLLLTTASEFVAATPPNMKNKNLSILTFITLFGPRSNI